jgi:hypothetical protein
MYPHVRYYVLTVMAMPSGKRQCVVWYTSTNTLEEPAVSILRISEDRGSRFL